ITPFTDTVELAFLDAFTAGVFVSASAGNSGPTAATVNHNGPWVITVAASTQARAFQSTLTLKSGTDQLDLVGSSLTEGIHSPMPVVKATDVPAYHGDIFCGQPPRPGTFTGMIVVCERGGEFDGQPIGRVQKGHNLATGGAAGMILFNSVETDTET